MAFTIVTMSLFSAGFGAWTALGILQAVTGRNTFSRFFGRGSSWTPGEIKVSGWSWAICGLAGIAMALVGGLELAARFIPLYWVSSPWGIVTANPWPLIFFGTLLFQLLIERHHRSRSRARA